MDGRFSPVSVGRGGYSPFSPSGYGMESNFDPVLSPRYGGNGNSSPHVGFDRGWSPFYNSSPNRYDSPIGYGGGISVTGSGLTSTTRNIWANGNLNYASNSSNSNDLMGSGSGSTGLVGAFGTAGTIWGSSNISGQVGGTDSLYSDGNISYSNMDNSLGSGVGHTEETVEIVLPHHYGMPHQVAVLMNRLENSMEVVRYLAILCGAHHLQS